MFESAFGINPFSLLFNFMLAILILGLIAGAFSVLGYLGLLKYKFRNREKESLDSTLIQVALPRDNEVKIDAAEQLFSSFASLHKSGKLQFLIHQPSLSFEIVGMPGDIRFYVSTPNKYKDFVEKQINGAYPDAEIKEVNEKDALRPGSIVGNDYNIFGENS